MAITRDYKNNTAPRKEASCDTTEMEKIYQYLHLNRKYNKYISLANIDLEQIIRVEYISSISSTDLLHFSKRIGIFMYPKEYLRRLSHMI
jgi:hypothetical protein